MTSGDLESDSENTTPQSEKGSDSSSLQGLIVNQAPQDKGWKLPRSDVHFAFGPETYYFIRCGTRWRFVRSNLSEWSGFDVKNVDWVAFKHNTGLILGGEQEDGRGRVVHSWNDGHMVRAGDVDAFVKSRDAYQRLWDWITDQTQGDIAKVRDESLTIGPEGSHFARVGSSWISHNLPAGLESTLHNDGRFPAVLALGIQGSYIILWSDGTRTWDLKMKYPSLRKSDVLPDEGENNKVIFAALSPFHGDHYFTVGQDGSTEYFTVSEDRKDSNQFVDMINQYKRYRANRDGTSFNQKLTTGGVTKFVHVSSEGGIVYENNLTRAWRERTGQLMKRNNLVLIGSCTGVAVLACKLSGRSNLTTLSFAAGVSVGAALSTLYRPARLKP